MMTKTPMQVRREAEEKENLGPKERLRKAHPSKRPILSQDNKEGPLERSGPSCF